MVEGRDYGYEIARELEEDWSSAAVYKALGRLRERKLIEPVGAEDGRRKQRYQATATGHEFNARRVARSLDSRHEMFSALLHAPTGTIVAVFDELEALLRTDVKAEPVSHPDWLSKMAWRERRKVNLARLEWIAEMRVELADAPLD